MGKQRTRQKSLFCRAAAVILLAAAVWLLGRCAGERNDNHNAASTTGDQSVPTAKHIVVLDPGHGGAYPGAQYQGFSEKELTLKLAQYVKEYLETHYKDVSVCLTRNSDALLSDDAAQDLKERVAVAARLNAQILVSLHFNTEPTAHASAGALACISKQENINSASNALANSILEQLAQLGIQNRGVLLRDHETLTDENGAPLDYYAICRHSAAAGIVGIIVEHCFMDNPAELQFFGNDEALQRLAMADAVGIADYMGLEPR